ncbi:predicted protein [Thalassiosira pseudonana CCMP1335]|uniref:Uncharacterized protein n=1 Tax=Thalassiosira pseudonana TaxID=35128 RepID=B8C4K6_THAPS|nr:predicted protein [Thalassiosira pseudonana CCMP1335]EED91741.1 predicted protein [Thalassiosira pseudonana CCMP1335]
MTAKVSPFHVLMMVWCCCTQLSVAFINLAHQSTHIMPLPTKACSPFHHRSQQVSLAAKENECDSKVSRRSALLQIISAGTGVIVATQSASASPSSSSSSVSIAQVTDPTVVAGSISLGTGAFFAVSSLRREAVSSSSSPPPFEVKRTEPIPYGLSQGRNYWNGVNLAAAKAYTGRISPKAQTSPETSPSKEEDVPPLIHSSNETSILNETTPLATDNDDTPLPDYNAENTDDAKPTDESSDEDTLVALASYTSNDRFITPVDDITQGSIDIDVPTELSLTLRDSPSKKTTLRSLLDRNISSTTPLNTEPATNVRSSNLTQLLKGNEERYQSRPKSY